VIQVEEVATVAAVVLTEAATMLEVEVEEALNRALERITMSRH
jgi:hypothetical protein